MSSCHDLVDQQTNLTDFSYQQQKLQQHNNMYHTNNNNYPSSQQYITKSSSHVNNTNTNNIITSTTTSFPHVVNNNNSNGYTQQQQQQMLSSTSTMNNYCNYNNYYNVVTNNNNNTNLTSNHTLPTTANNTPLKSNSCNQTNSFNTVSNNLSNTVSNNNNQIHEKQTVQNHTFDTPSDKYSVTEIIGSGTYGVVAICKDSSDHSYALKKNIRVFPDENDLNPSSNSNGNTNGKYTAFNNSGKLHQLRMLRELKMLHHLRNCPNIVSLKDVYVPNQLNELRDIEMVTSLMEADLRDIFDSGQVLSPKHVKWFMYQICLSVYYMQKANILHRDLKPENILVNSQCDVAICDFGLARGYYNSNKVKSSNQSNVNGYQSNGGSETLSHIIDINSMNNPMNQQPSMNSHHHNNNGMIDDEDLSENQTKLSSNYVVSRWYRPPELLTNATQIYNKTLDMWSVGCIMYELLSCKGEVLFKGSGSIDQIQRIIKQLGTPAFDDFNGSEAARDYIYNKFPICKRRSFTKRLPPNTCPMAIDLMKRMLTFNMFKRINPHDALNHPYFREFYDPFDLSIPLSPFDTAWEEKMYQSADLKIEAFNTLQSIKRDHYIELQLQLQQDEQQQIDDEQQQQPLEQFNEEDILDDQDEYQDLMIHDDNPSNSINPNTLQHYQDRIECYEDQILASTYTADQQQQLNDSKSSKNHLTDLMPSISSSSNNEEDFLRMVVDNNTNIHTMNGINNSINSNTTTSMTHCISKSKIDNFSPTATVEMSVSYHTSHVYDSFF